MIHNVYFWLKKDLTDAQRATFEKELILLSEVDYLANGRVGKPAATEPRPVIDSSYDYFLTTEFKNMADHDFYQKECPKHQRFLDTCKTFWDRVVVYDSTPIN